jgi:1-acyl-sn-glycerol-3-phosphate acyltransferase
MAVYSISSLVLFFLVLLFLGHKAHVADWGNPFINIIDGWVRLYCRYFHRLIYQPIPVCTSALHHTPALLASNHLTGLDPFLLVAACARPIRFMIAKEEYERFGLQWLFRAAGCIPVERSGRVETAFRASLKALADGEVVAIFPEGGIHHPDKPPKRLKAGIVKLAKLTQLPIIAIQVDGMRAQGHTLPALLLPSHSRLRVIAKLDCREITNEHCLTQLALFLQLQN